MLKIKNEALIDASIVMSTEHHLPEAFIRKVVDLARDDSDLYDLLLSWLTSSDDDDEQEEAYDKFQDHLKDHYQLVLPKVLPKPRKPPHRPKARVVNPHIKEFKENLRDLIDRHGGVVKIAIKAGMLQPALSRILSSDSMPRRTTLYRIARAMNIPDSKVKDWLK